jgi:hypothetical protein
MSPKTVARRHNELSLGAPTLGLPIALMTSQIVDRMLENRGVFTENPFHGRSTQAMVMSSGADHCTLAEHAALRANDKAWDALPWKSDWVFEDEVLEQRDCKCGSTLARPKRIVVLDKLTDGTLVRWVSIAGAVHAIRFYNGVHDGARLRGDRLYAAEAKQERVRIELALLELCVKGTP